MDGKRTGVNVGRRRQTLWDQMSAIENGRTDSLAGLTLDAILGTNKGQPSSALAPTPSQLNRTLLDIIRDEEPDGSLFGHKDKKSWKAFRDRLRLKRAGSAWISSIHIPTSDIPINNNSSSRSHRYSGNNQRSFMGRRSSVRFITESTHLGGESSQLEDTGDGLSSSASAGPSRASMMTRRSSTRYDPDLNSHAVGDMPPARSFRPQISRHNSTRLPSELDVEDGVAREGTRRVAVAEERQLSAREAVAAQEAAEAEAALQAAAEAAAAAAEEEENDDDDEDEEEEERFGAGGGGNPGAGAPVRMSLMDLLEETDRQMGFEGSRYIVGDDDFEGEDDEVEEEDGDEEGNNGGVEHTCCVCMVRHKGAAFIPCGHTFCRLCSRELWAQRGNCPLCNGYILEILDIF